MEILGVVFVQCKSYPASSLGRKRKKKQISNFKKHLTLSNRVSIFYQALHRLRCVTFAAYWKTRVSCSSRAMRTRSKDSLWNQHSLACGCSFGKSWLTESNTAGSHEFSHVNIGDLFRSWAVWQYMQKTMHVNKEVFSILFAIWHMVPLHNFAAALAWTVF